MREQSNQEMAERGHEATREKGVQSGTHQKKPAGSKYGRMGCLQDQLQNFRAECKKKAGPLFKMIRNFKTLVAEH